MILAGDIGGTNTRLAIFTTKSGRLAMRERRDFKNAGRSALAPIVKEFLEPLSHKLKIACFGVAGPVKLGRATMTNLKWTMDEKKLASALRVPRVALINDLVAHAEGINELRPKDTVTLHRGTPAPRGNRAIIAPGTGLGEAGLTYDEHSDDYRAFASEGGHSDFAPTDDREVALMRFVRDRLGRCSWEDVLSGPGLKNIYEFLTTPGEFQIESAQPGRETKPAEISGAAVSGECPASIAAVEMFATFLAAEAGNLALKMLATGSIYIGGGIASYILKFLKQPRVHDAFVKKGPPSIQKLLDRIPIHVITSNDGALFGAAHFAQRLLGEVRVKR
ncbi:MAG: glucokinase [Anaerolineae bacterium]|nr:glucokinase [Phycisphaerae bacterium]